MRDLFKCNIAILCVFILTILSGCILQNPQLSLKRQGFVTINGGSLYYQKFGSGIPIIVVHGGPGLDQGYLQPQLLQLASDYELIFYDQRGSGKSLDTKINEKYITLPQFIEDLEALRNYLGFNKFILMGHSWGGFLAMQYAFFMADKILFLFGLQKKLKRLYQNLKS